MRTVVQRVSQAQVEIDGQIVGQIAKGLLVYLGVGKGDTSADAALLAEKMVNLRIFPDENDKMNLSLLDVGGGVLLISQFTLQGDCRKGRRPGFDQAEDPTPARQLYEETAQLIRDQGVTVATGVFGAHMLVTSTNVGPVTFLLDSKRLF
jgi:D-aminoacyl-tRNA deacylase